MTVAAPGGSDRRREVRADLCARCETELLGQLALLYAAAAQWGRARSCNDLIPKVLQVFACDLLRKFVCLSGPSLFVAV